MTHSHARSHRSVTRLFTTGLSGGELGRLLRDLDRCDRCGALYNRYAAVEAALSGDRSHALPLAIERLESAVLDAAGAQVTRGRYSLWRLVPALAGVGAFALLLLWIWPAPPSADRVALDRTAALSPVALRSKGTSAPLRGQNGVRLFKVVPDSSGVAEGASLSLEGVITFTYTNVSPEVGYLALFGVQPGGEIRWYAPGYDTQESVSISRDAVDEPLGFGVRLKVNHRPGALRVVALFSSEPIPTARITEVVQSDEGTSSLESALSSQGFSSLGVYDAHSFVIEIAPAPPGPQEGGP